MSKYKNVIPMTVPRVGNNQQKPQVDIKQATMRTCECGSKYFDKVFKVGLISKLAPGNTMQQDIPVEIICYVCHKCGVEMNPLENKAQE